MPMDSYAAAIDSALSAAPNLANYPSLALAAASDPQPDLAAQAVAFAQQQQAMQVASTQAVQLRQSQQAQAASATAEAKSTEKHGLFGDFMHILGAPAREVSHLYRYTREAFHMHGVYGGLSVLLPTAVGGILGGVFLGPMGATIGAELGAEFSRKVNGGTNEADYQASSNGATFQIDGKAVSFGRDITRLIPGLDDNTDKGFSKFLSGAADAAFSVETDPTNVVGKLSAIRRSKEGFSALPLIGPRIAAKDGFMARIAPGMKVSTPERLDLALTAYSGVRRAFSRIGQLDAGGVVHEFPELTPFAKELGKTKSFDDVKEFFRQATINENFQEGILGHALPSLSLFRPVTNKVRDALMVDDINAAGIGRKVPAKVWKTITGQQPFNVDALNNITGEFHPDDVNALKGVYQTMRFSMGTKAARTWTTTFANASSITEKRAIWARAMTEMLKTAGFPDDLDAFNKVTGRRLASRWATVSTATS
jgi:hypothetical protein